jgi:hypothetical protein
MNKSQDPEAAETDQNTSVPAVDMPRLARHRLGRVEIDREVFMSERHPCLTIASKLSAAGFPLDLGIMGPELWSDEKWKWEKFREAAAQAGATWWAWHEDVGDRLFVFEWGSMANASLSHEEGAKQPCKHHRHHPRPMVSIQTDGPPSLTSTAPVPLFGTWTPITAQLPEVDDLIACCAEHHRGGPMYWAGMVVEVHRTYALMEVKNEFPRRFVITDDTLWLKLPMPNTCKTTP